jgi:predicted RNase H-like nuclease
MRHILVPTTSRTSGRNFDYAARMFVVGVDGCKGGWVAVALEGGQFAGAASFARFDELLDAVEDAVAVGVDMPIGLHADAPRVCDALARELVGPRRASVFLTPPRPALAAESYDEANSLCRMLTGQGLSRQAYGLRAKIFEVERALGRAAPQGGAPRESARRLSSSSGSHRRPRKPLPAGRVVEIHPEASFREMGNAHLGHAKKTYSGMMLRMRLLEAQGIVLPTELEEVGGVAIDDVFDAAAVAWSANRYAHRKAKCLPPRELWQHDGQRPLAIWI